MRYGVRPRDGPQAHSDRAENVAHSDSAENIA